MKFSVFYAFIAALIPLFTMVLAETEGEFGAGEEEAKLNYSKALSENSSRLSLMAISGISMYGLCMAGHWGHCIQIGVVSATGASVAYDVVPRAKDYLTGVEDAELYQVLREGLVGMKAGAQHVLGYFQAAIQDENDL